MDDKLTSGHDFTALASTAPREIRVLADEHARLNAEHGRVLVAIREKQGARYLTQRADSAALSAAMKAGEPDPGTPAEAALDVELAQLARQERGYALALEDAFQALQEALQTADHAGWLQTVADARERVAATLRATVTKAAADVEAAQAAVDSADAIKAAVVALEDGELTARHLHNLQSPHRRPVMVAGTPAIVERGQQSIDPAAVWEALAAYAPVEVPLAPVFDDGLKTRRRRSGSLTRG